MKPSEVSIAKEVCFNSFVSFCVRFLEKATSLEILLQVWIQPFHGWGIFKNLINIS